MHKLICSCLQLPADCWPPDHYTLLGLEPSVSDTRQIEQRVQERMEKLRRYQLTHADQVTDGMNRLAQALVCLTDPVAKQAYDAMLLARTAGANPRAQAGPPPRSSTFHFSAQAGLECAPTRQANTRRFPRWLCVAWSLWLLVGVAGLGALFWNYPDIKASYLRATDGAKPAKRLREPRAAVPFSAGRKGP
jgi:hypothetical protein